jgi:hypothetical protein
LIHRRTIGNYSVRCCLRPSSPYYSCTLLLQSPIRCCDGSSAGGLVPQTHTVPHEYAPGPQGSTHRSRDAAQRFRDELSWIMQAGRLLKMSASATDRGARQEKRRDPKFEVRSSRNLELRVSNPRPSRRSRSAILGVFSSYLRHSDHRSSPVPKWLFHSLLGPVETELARVQQRPSQF